MDSVHRQPGFSHARSHAIALAPAYLAWSRRSGVASKSRVPSPTIKHHPKY
jgi:hypothetical protein